MEFLTQTIFAFAVIGYIYSIKDHKKKSSIILFILSLICLTAYIGAYLYLLFTKELNWIKTLALIVVICFSILSIKHYFSLD